MDLRIPVGMNAIRADRRNLSARPAFVSTSAVWDSSSQGQANWICDANERVSCVFCLLNAVFRSFSRQDEQDALIIASRRPFFGLVQELLILGNSG